MLRMLVRAKLTLHQTQHSPMPMIMPVLYYWTTRRIFARCLRACRDVPSPIVLPICQLMGPNDQNSHPITAHAKAHDRSSVTVAAMLCLQKIDAAKTHFLPRSPNQAARGICWHSRNGCTASKTCMVIFHKSQIFPPAENFCSGTAWTGSTDSPDAQALSGLLRTALGTTCRLALTRPLSKSTQ